MQLLIDAQNDSPEQINLAIIYLQQVLTMRAPENVELRTPPKAKATPAPLSEIAPDPLAPEQRPTRKSDADADPTKAETKPAKAKASKPEVVKTVTQDEVRQVMVVKQGEGKAPAIKALLAEYSSTKISEIALDKLAEFKSKLEVL